MTFIQLTDCPRVSHPGKDDGLKKATRRCYWRNMRGKFVYEQGDRCCCVPALIRQQEDYEPLGDKYLCIIQDR